ncbi:MAG TPA: dihydroneopterin aldolase [Azospirillaceae bacterium]|nr:dihydroneopterin aldolase [Azospirillaceae bacterium]
MPSTAPTARYTLLLRDLVVDARIGVHAHEQTGGQAVRIGIEADVELPAAPRDRIEDVLSYELLADAARGAVGDSHTFLVETLGERIAAACLADPRVVAVRVQVEKPDVMPGCVVGVRLERRRGDVPSP